MKTKYILVTCNLMERTLNVDCYDQLSTCRTLMSKRHKFAGPYNTVQYDSGMRTVTYDSLLNCVQVSRIVKKEV